MSENENLKEFEILTTQRQRKEEAARFLDQISFSVSNSHFSVNWKEIDRAELITFLRSDEDFQVPYGVDDMRCSTCAKKMVDSLLKIAGEAGVIKKRNTNKRLTKEAIKKRRETCGGCEFKRSMPLLGVDQCSVCLCILKLKTKASWSDCPKGKWE